MTSSEDRLACYLRALVQTLQRRRKNAFELCHLIGVDRAEALEIWRDYQ